MIKLSRLLSNSPIPITQDIVFSQPKLNEIVDMGEELYWTLIKIWAIDRQDLIEEETEELKQLDDFEIWRRCIFSSPDLQQRLLWSVDCLLKQKVEFMPMSGTILIGGNDSSVMIDNTFYLTMRDIAKSIMIFSGFGSDDDSQYKETKNMSAREREMIRKMKANAEKIDRIKNGDRKTEDQLIKRIVSLVAIGHYTFDQVYEMTMLQLIFLLKKYSDIEQYELHVALSPYIDSKKNEPVKHWLET